MDYIIDPIIFPFNLNLIFADMPLTLSSILN